MSSSLIPSAPRTHGEFWDEAIQNLPVKDRTLFLKYASGRVSNVNDIFEEIVTTVKAKQEGTESKRWKFEFLGRQLNVRDEADKVIQWLDTFKQAGDVAVNVDPLHAGLPWAAIRVLLQAAVSDRVQYGAILVGVKRILYVLKRCRIYFQLYLETTVPKDVRLNLEEALTESYSLILQFLARVLRLYEMNAIQRATQAFLIPDRIQSFEKECMTVEQRMHLEASNFERHLNNEGRELLQKLKDLNQLKDSMDAIGTKMESVWALQSKKRKGQVLRWISQLPHVDHHADAKAGRTEGTGQWIFKHQNYERWESSTDSMILWLHGIPGAGKTKLVTHVVDRLKQSSYNEALAYFYCSRSDESRRNATDVLRSFVKQLAALPGSDELHKSVLDIHDQKEESGFASAQLNVGEAEGLLRELMSGYPKVTLVLDALDECLEEQRAKLIGTLNKMIESEPHLKIIISSRRNDDIKRRLRQKANIGIEATDNARDNQTFVLEQIERDHQRREQEGLEGISEDLNKEIVETLFEKSQGIFQWASLQANQILSLQRQSQIRLRLGRLPIGLDATYKEIWHSVAEDDRDDRATIAAHAIQWMLASEEPLELDMLIAAICQDPDNDDLSLVDVDEELLLGACQNLIVVTREHRGELTFAYCRFAHLSVQEYFEAYGPWKLPECQETVANVCLKIILAAADNEHNVRYTLRVQEPEEHPLFRYATKFWPHWIRSLGEYPTHRRTLFQLRQIFTDPFAASSTYAHWYWRLCGQSCEEWELRNSTFPLSTILANSNAHAIIHICAFGFAWLLQEWFTKYDIDAREHYGRKNRTLLWFAACNGNIGTLRLLLDRENAYEPTGALNDALMVAVVRGHTNVVDSILEHGTDVNANSFGELSADVPGMPLSSNGFGSPLAAAAYLGNTRMVELLIRHGANVNARLEGVYGSAIAAAAAAYKEPEVIELLCKEGADVNAPIAGKYGSALIAAVASPRDHKAIVELLLDKGADINTRVGRAFGNALEAAVLTEKIGCVEFLLEKGADVNAPSSGRYGSALAAAASRRSIRCMELLLTAGADINAHIGGNFGSALAVAASYQSTKHVALLLERGVYIDSQIPGRFGSALAAAAFNGGLKVVKLLLAVGADANLQIEGEFGSALAAAARTMVEYPDWALSEQLKVLETLIQHGADVNARLQGRYASALDATLKESESGAPVEVIRLLLKRGAEVSDELKEDRRVREALSGFEDGFIPSQLSSQYSLLHHSDA